jgi:serine/threonine-protein kinase
MDQTVPLEAGFRERKADHDSLLGATIEGRYRIDAKLGSGGMGSVYRASRLLIGDEVAIKILHPDKIAEPQMAERFRREAQAAARLKHPNAVSVYDFGVSHDGLCYLVMELVDGDSVRHIIKRQGPFTPSAAAGVISQVCAALDEAHRQNIIHRDIKPDNIMVDVGINGLRVKVLDFGIAKLRDEAAGNLTQTGSVVGTPHYMSPEQCIGEELDSRSDIYSVGIVLYEMLAGVVPFNSPTSTAVVVQHVNQPPPSLRAVNMSIPPSVEAVVMHALEKRREARPQAAVALAQELNAAVSAVNPVQSTQETLARPVLPNVGFAPSAPAPFTPAMVAPSMAPSGNLSFNSVGSSAFPGGKTQVRGKTTALFVILSLVVVASIVAILYLVLTRSGTQVGALPDHYGIFARAKDVLTELQRREFRNVIEGRDNMVGDSSLPRIEAKPTLILYAEGQDIPVSDLKLVQLDSVDPSGKVSYWNYQVAPVDGHPGMKQIRVAGGLASGKYAFALINGFMDEGNHKFWPFQVSDDTSAPADSPQVAMIPLKPKPAPTPRPVAPPSAAAAPPPGARIAYCTDNNVVLRSGPGLNAPRAGPDLSRGQRLYVLQMSTNYDNWRGFTSNWAYVKTDTGASGWVFGHFVSQ